MTAAGPPDAEARTPSVLFVCARNGGKSPMAEGLMRDLVEAAGNRVDVASAGTDPGTAPNALSVQVLAEVGVDIAGHVPRRLTPELVAGADRVVVLGREAQVDGAGTRVETWETDEPSVRGIEGIERMRLVRDDIAARVRRLAHELGID
ncbi:low molecular weight phosphatase family protein [Nocardioidaceae bacterium]|nr:low molecular weight phosphatase family protein [Nocardioidaceae bacterium]